MKTLIVSTYKTRSFLLLCIVIAMMLACKRLMSPFFIAPVYEYTIHGISSEYALCIQKSLKEHTDSMPRTGSDLIAYIQNSFPIIQDVSLVFQPHRVHVVLYARTPLCIINGTVAFIAPDIIIDKHFFDPSIVASLPSLSIVQHNHAIYSIIPRFLQTFMPYHLHCNALLVDDHCIYITDKNESRFVIVAAVESILSDTLFGYCQRIKNKLLERGAFKKNEKWLADVRFADHIIAYKGMGEVMARVMNDRIIVSIDIGTTKICVLVARKIAEHLEVIGIGKSPSYGLQKGVVVDVAKTISSIAHAVKEAEIMAGISIESAYIGISGGHISSCNSTGVVPIKRGQIQESDVAAVLDAAKAIALAEGRQILHVLSQFFIIDGSERVQEPIGMHAVRLEVQAHIITGSVSSVQNLVNCCQGAGILVNDIILEQLASADAVLSDDECDLGVGVLDIGGGTSDFAVYRNASIRHTMVLPVAGNHVTNDIAIGLRVMKHEAERIKKQYGLASTDLIETDRFIEVELMQGQDRQIILLSDLTRIIEPRMEELFKFIKNEIEIHQLLPVMTNGLVLTGGGALLEGASEVAAKIFGCPVRIGKPRLLFDLVETLQSPLYSTGYGILIHVLKNEEKVKKYSLQGPVTKRIFDRMKSWVSEFF